MSSWLAQCCLEKPLNYKLDSDQPESKPKVIVFKGRAVDAMVYLIIFVSL
jgi:hypothetical protein